MGRRSVVVVAAAAVVVAGLSACGGQGPSASAYSSRLAAAFDADEGGDLPQKEAGCLAQKFVALVGTSRLRSVVPTPETLVLADLKDLGLNPGEVEGLSAECGVEVADVDVESLEGLPAQIIVPALAGPYSRAIASFATFDGSNADLSEEAAACVGHAAVGAAGVDVIARLGTPAELTAARNLESAGLEVTESAADAFGPALAACGVSLRGVLGPALARVSDERVASCLLASLDDTELSRFGYMSLVGPGLSAGPSPDAVSVDLPLMGCGFFGSTDNRAYVDGLAAGLRIDPAFPSEGDNAACVARDFVGTVTPQALKEAGISAMSLRAGNVFALGLDEAGITALIKAFEACGQPAVDLIIHMLGLNMPLAPDEATCMRSTMDPLLARDFLVSGIAMGMEALTLDSPATRGLIEVLSECGVGSGGSPETGSMPPRRA